MRKFCNSTLMLLLMCSVSQSWAQIVVDGSLDVAYNVAALQENRTGFGDATAENDFQGSELDGLYTAFEDGKLFVMITGNLEGNFNKLEVFFDTVEGGENILSDAPQYDFNVGEFWNSQFLGAPVSGPNPEIKGAVGFTMDAGFEVDYHLYARRGFIGEDPFNVLDVDFADRMGGGSAAIPWNTSRTTFDFDNQVGNGTITPADLGSNASGSALTGNIDFALDNNNADGVGGLDPKDPMAGDPVAAAAVGTGLEFCIDLADLGIDPKNSATIKIMACVNNGDHNFPSNQFLPSLPAITFNLGGDNNGGFIGDCGLVDLTAFEGDQFACVEYVAEFILGDVNCDGAVTLADIPVFVDLLSTGGFSEKADIDGNGSVGLSDIPGFVAILSGG